MQSKQVIQILKDMLRGRIIEFRAKCCYNNSFQSSIQMAPYETLYGRKCQTPLCWTELGERKVLGPELVQESEGKIVTPLTRIQRQNRRKVLRFGRRGKLSPRFIGPYRILKRVSLVAYQLELPHEME
ncbi:DNA/RNA polymerase superfamily protein [Gossypium australe]|uniref:DNA/RNA polymerase superfamily protein n=1 Tax=Gossypium australe TaxID=47621 RepID=A0A5B6VPB2_9ROSI|nr:DNA/RNA polymerase superfamily protein [Gossypium australe]